MLPNPEYINQKERFWAIVKLVSEGIGYSERKKSKKGAIQMKRYTTKDILECHKKLKVPTSSAFDRNDRPKVLARRTRDYLNYRSEILESYVSKQLMNKEQARKEFELMRNKYSGSKIKLQMNKQKGDKKHPNYLVNMVNLVAEAKLNGDPFDNDPMKMGVVVDSKGPLKVLCRRMDGAYPSTYLPKIIWEVKEYYGTTTFGSRIADGVYETMLVGEELKELRNKHSINISHVLFVDDYYTWWVLGRSYLCRLIDMLNMGYVDAIFFGREVKTEWAKFIQSQRLPRKQ